MQGPTYGSTEHGELIDLTRRPRPRRPIGHRTTGGYPLGPLFRKTRKIGNRADDNGNARVIYRYGYSPDPRDWTWIDWVFIIGLIITFAVIVAGFVLIVISRNQCCL